MPRIDYAKLYTKRNDGRYQGQYYDADGKRHLVCDKDPEMLYHKLKQKEDEANGKITFREIAENWHTIAWGRITDGTKANYEAHYNKAVEEFGERVASDIEPYEFEKHLQRMNSMGYSASSIKSQRVVCSQIYKEAIIDKRFGQHIKSNPLVNVPLPAGMKKANAREAPGDDVVKRIRDSVETAYFGLFPMFLISTGFRRGEALAVRWSDIDFVRKRILCTKSISHRKGGAKECGTKTGAGVREVLLLPELSNILMKQPKHDKDEYLFHGEDPFKPLSLATYERRYLRYCKEMGFVTDVPEERTSKQNKKYVVHHYKPTLTAHHFRHGYATMLFEADVDVYTAKVLLGHASIDTTMKIYTHLRERKKNASMEKLESYAGTFFSGRDEQEKSAHPDSCLDTGEVQHTTCGVRAS